MMKVRQPIFFFLAGVLAVVVLGYFAHRIYFVINSTVLDGTIVEIEGLNTRCKSGRRSYYSCTKFYATVRYLVDFKEYHLDLTAGNARGHNAHRTQASRQLGSVVPLRVDLKNPTHAYENTILGIFLTPLLFLGGQLISLFASFSEPKRSTRWR